MAAALRASWAKHAALPCYPLDTGKYSAAVRLVGVAFQLCLFYIGAPPTAYELFTNIMAPGHPLWALLVLWAAAYYSGHVFESVGAPKALGQLLAGFVLRNLSAAGRLEKTEQMLNGDWSRDLRACAMALVLVRAGLGIDMATVRSYGLCIPAMALLPSLIESLTGAAVATAIIPGMPLLLGWTMSFIVSAVGPAIVSAGCGAVKDRGFNPRAPNFLMTTCCFDDAVCIIGCLLHAWIQSDGDVGYQYAIGPLNLVFGIVGGLAASLVASCTCLWSHAPGARTAMVYSLSSVLILVAERNSLLGAGALANLVFGLATRRAWQAGGPFPSLVAAAHAADAPAEAARMLRETLKWLYAVWNIVFYPLLFGLVGALLDTSTVKAETAKVAIGYAFFAVGMRAAATALVVQLPFFSTRFTRGERAFMSLAWISKATTQAAFATTPQISIMAWIAANLGKSYKGLDSAQLLYLGDQIKWCAVLSIFIGTPLGTIFMNNLASRLLAMDHHHKAGGEDSKLEALHAIVVAPSAAGSAPDIEILGPPGSFRGGGGGGPAAGSGAPSMRSARAPSPPLRRHSLTASVSLVDQAAAPVDAAPRGGGGAPAAAPAAASAAAPPGLPPLSPLSPQPPPPPGPLSGGSSLRRGRGGGGGGGGGEPSDARRRSEDDAAASAAAAAACRLTITYAGVSADAEESVRALLLESNARLAEIVGRPVRLEINRDAAAGSSHPVSAQDPNAAVAEAEEAARAARPAHGGAAARLARRLGFGAGGGGGAGAGGREGLPAVRSVSDLAAGNGHSP